jgi:hypothetical protein
MVHFGGNFICKTMQFIILYMFLKKMKKNSLEILANGKRNTFISKYPICSLGAFLNDDHSLDVIPTCKFIMK